MNAELKARYKVQLAEVDAAITKINAGGQSSAFSGSGGSSQVTRANLKDLEAQRTALENKLYPRKMKVRRAVS